MSPLLAWTVRTEVAAMQDQLNRMRSIAERHANGVRSETILPRVALHVGVMTVRPVPSVYEPSLCLVLQGAKQVTIGNRVLRYDPASYFIATVDLPASGWVVEGTRTHPYVAVSMKLDRALLSSVILDMPDVVDGETAGFAVSAVTPDLIDAWSRLLALLDAPDDVPVLGPMHEREVLYRLLKGPQGGALRQIVRVDSRLSQVRRAISCIRSHYNEVLRVEQLAELASMSPASFHRHFKAATAMSPLQYQKMLPAPWGRAPPTWSATRALRSSAANMPACSALHRSETPSDYGAATRKRPARRLGWPDRTDTIAYRFARRRGSAYAESSGRSPRPSGPSLLDPG